MTTEEIPQEPEFEQKKEFVDSETAQKHEKVDEVRQRATGMKARQTSAHELLILSNLKASVTALPLRKIQLICDAAYMVPEEVLGEYIDYPRMEIFRAVVETFVHGQELMEAREHVIALAWPFDNTEANYKKFITPWIGGGKIVSGDMVDDPGLLQIAQQQGHDVPQDWMTFFYFSDSMSPGFFRELLGRFELWAVPYINEIAATVAVSLSPQVQRAFEKAVLNS